MELKIKCKSCQEESYQTVYLYDEQILTCGTPFSDRKEYTASVRGKSICPRCGQLSDTQFTNEIYPSEIIDLAVRRYKR